MSKDNFFYKKKDWSRIKDDLLGYYLKLYFAKVLMNRAPVTYIDAFAGKGKFDDGEIGSPIMALNIADSSIIASCNLKANIECYFIESKFSKELSENVIGRKATTISGYFEDEIEDILRKCSEKNVFLYVDPFGIKNLHFEKFRLLDKKKYKSVELLLNLNSFGFLREGCRLLKYKEFAKQNEILEERESAEGTRCINDMFNMNRVANGVYWQKIIMDYNNGLIDAFAAEERFVREYCMELGRIFNFVINIPIKAKNLRNMPKYQMVFCTNHKHGLIEMSNNMCKRWKQMQEDERNGQIMLFEMNKDFKGLIIQLEYEEIVLEELTSTYISLDDLIIKIILKHGVLCSVSEIKKKIKELEINDTIQIQREPAFTLKNRPAKWVDWKFNNKDKKDLKVRLKGENCKKIY
ncbi:MAG: three-Cys-motif partner protein TcmP [Alkaliphilus sp.]